MCEPTRAESRAQGLITCRRPPWTSSRFCGNFHANMRIIGGIHRSRKLLAPRDSITTRPITDRVKQSLFDRLFARGALDCDAAVDVFCGTGSLGLEALSRGVRHCTFVERDLSARKLLDQNIAALGLVDQATVFAADAMGGVWLTMLQHQPVSLVFCDPPYEMTTGNKLLRVLELIEMTGPAMDDQATLTLRTDRHSKPTPVSGFAGPESHGYGSMTVHLYTREIADATATS